MLIWIFINLKKKKCFIPGPLTLNGNSSSFLVWSLEGTQTPNNILSLFRGLSGGGGGGGGGGGKWFSTVNMTCNASNFNWLENEIHL